MFEYACMCLCTRANTEAKLVTAIMGGGGRSMLKSANGTAYRYNNLHTSILHIQQAHFMNITRKIAQCFLISAVQPFSTQCGPTSLLNSLIWSCNFLDLRAQPPPAGRLATSLLNNGLFEPTLPYQSLSSPPPNHSHYFHSHHVFLTSGGLGKKENGTWHFLSTRHPTHQSGNL